MHYTNYSTPQPQLHYITTTTTAALHHRTSSNCVWGDRPGDHCNHCNHSKKQKIQPLFSPSVDSLCHLWFTTTNLSYRVPILKLPPPPCAALLVTNQSSKNPCHGQSAGTTVVYLPPSFLEDCLTQEMVGHWHHDPRNLPGSDDRSLTPGKNIGPVVVQAVAYASRTFLKLIHQLYQSHPCVTHFPDSWKSPAALPAGLLVLCWAGQLWQWWGLHYERPELHFQSGVLLFSCNQTWLAGKSLSIGHWMEAKTVIDVPLACLITRESFELNMFESGWWFPKTFLQVFVFL